MPPEYVAVHRVAEVDQFAEFLDSFGHHTLRQPIQQALQPKQFTARLLRIERRFLQGNADPQTHITGLRTDVEASHRRRATARREQRAEHPHDRRFSGAVRPEETVDLAAGDFQIDTVNGNELAELAPQRASSDRGITHRTSIIGTARTGRRNSLVVHMFGEASKVRRDTSRRRHRHHELIGPHSHN
jgi:hypothetical protein